MDGRSASYRRPPKAELVSAEAIGDWASECLILEIDTFPKPGLVSHIDNGSHRDMDAGMLRRSALLLAPFFMQLATAGMEDASMDRLRAIGMEAEAAMLAQTRGVNTHRGAIFGLGLLCAASGRRLATSTRDSLGTIARTQWARDIVAGPVLLHSHGTRARRMHGAPGARGEAASGFPAVYGVGLPALRKGREAAPYDPEAVRVHAILALIAEISDTNLLHRGGMDGLTFARTNASAFMRAGGIARPGWRLDATFLHAEFVARRLSPGGAADLLAMSLFVQGVEDAAAETR